MRGVTFRRPSNRLLTVWSRHRLARWPFPSRPSLCPGSPSPACRSVLCRQPSDVAFLPGRRRSCRPRRHR
jgi:hypothetical protein